MWTPEEARDLLSSEGLPLNWMPERASFVALRARGWTLEQAVEYYRPLIKRYEAYVNRPAEPNA
jgi:hypothetical protein